MAARPWKALVAAGVFALVMLVPVRARADAPGRLAGIVTDFHGKYGLVVRDASGRVIDVVLHQGTIIKPEGLRLERGMQVTVLGRADSGSFAASEIETPSKLLPSRAALAISGPTVNELRNSRRAFDALGNPFSTAPTPTAPFEALVPDPRVPGGQ
jgi:hypothetical protein